MRRAAPAVNNGPAPPKSGGGEDDGTAGKRIKNGHKGAQGAKQAPPSPSDGDGDGN
jgi:hypothetical protein